MPDQNKQYQSPGSYDQTQRAKAGKKEEQSLLKKDSPDDVEIGKHKVTPSPRDS